MHWVVNLNRLSHTLLRHWASKILRSRLWPFGVTWHHQSRDHRTHNYAGSYRCPFEHASGTAWTTSLASITRTTKWEVDSLMSWCAFGEPSNMTEEWFPATNEWLQHTADTSYRADFHAVDVVLPTGFGYLDWCFTWKTSRCSMSSASIVHVLQAYVSTGDAGITIAIRLRLIVSCAPSIRWDSIRRQKWAWSLDVNHGHTWLYTNNNMARCFMCKLYIWILIHFHRTLHRVVQKTKFLSFHSFILIFLYFFF